MPVFINEVIIRTSVERAGQQAGAGGSAAPAGEPFDKAALVAEVTRSLMDYLERERDRIGER